MSVWREVQEAVLAWWETRWADAAPMAYQDETQDPVDGPHGRLWVQQRPGGPGTLGRPGSRKMDRRGAATVTLRQPPDRDSGALSDLAEKARDAFENCRLAPHDIRFADVQIGPMIDVEAGRWSGVTVEAPFDYEQHK